MTMITNYLDLDFYKNTGKIPTSFDEHVYRKLTFDPIEEDLDSALNGGKYAGKFTKSQVDRYYSDGVMYVYYLE